MLESLAGIGLGIGGYYEFEDNFISGNLMSDILYFFLAYCLFGLIGITIIGIVQHKLVKKKANSVNAILGAAAGIILSSMLLSSIILNVLLLGIFVMIIGAVAFNAGLHNWLDKERNYS